MKAEDILSENKAIVRRFYEEVINKGDATVMDQIMASNFVEHNAPQENTGLEGFRQFLNMIATAFPDIQVSIEDMLAEGDKVATRVVVKGTHQGPLMGNIPPTGKKAAWTGIDIFTIKDRKIVERWSQRDIQGLMSQLGLSS